VKTGVDVVMIRDVLGHRLVTTTQVGIRVHRCCIKLVNS
jgi:site-specific recombinase XerD